MPFYPARLVILQYKKFIQANVKRPANLFQCIEVCRIDLIAPAVEENQTILLDSPTFYQYLKEASVDYLLWNPIDKEEVEA